MSFAYSFTKKVSLLAKPVPSRKNICCRAIFFLLHILQTKHSLQSFQLKQDGTRPRDYISSVACLPLLSTTLCAGAGNVYFMSLTAYIRLKVYFSYIFPCFIHSFNNLFTVFHHVYYFFLRS